MMMVSSIGFERNSSIIIMMFCMLLSCIKHITRKRVYKVRLNDIFAVVGMLLMFIACVSLCMCTPQYPINSTLRLCFG